MDNFIVKEHTISCQHIRGYYQSTATSQEEQLHLAVKQYIPRYQSQPGDVTIIAAHCAGTFKELYEPLFSALISTTRIRSIWIADVVTHGQSSIMNEGKLGIDFSWDDHARDLLHMTNVFRDEMIRPIVGLGHSAGGTMILRLAAMHPRLFASVLAIEPAVSKEYSPAMNYAPTYFLSYRKDIWPSREQAFEETKKTGAQRFWHPAVLEKWYEYGFRETPTLQHSEPGVTLTTTKHHDARAYARAVHPAKGESLLEMEVNHRTHPDITQDDVKSLKQPAYAPTAIAAFRDLPYLLPSALFIYGDRITTAASQLENRAAISSVIGTDMGGSGGVAREKYKEVIIPKSGHFVPLEKPEIVASICADWLHTQMECWKDEEQHNQEEWNSRGDVRAKASLDQDWMWWAKEAYGKKKSKDASKEKMEKPIERAKI